MLGNCRNGQLDIMRSAYNCACQQSKIVMESTGCKRTRNRCYSSMNYQEYEDFFGTPPKMPEAPVHRPLLDPLFDMPELVLEEYPTDLEQPPKQIRRINYKIEPIPEIEGSQNNSMAIESPQKYFTFCMHKVGQLESDRLEIQEIETGKRKRYRPRSYSENSPLNYKLRIIDFLSELKDSQSNLRKQVKMQ